MAKKRDTPRKQAILRMLEANWGDEYADYGDPGPPPYTATRIAEYIDYFGGENGRVWIDKGNGMRTCEGLWSPSDSVVQSFARTLRRMAAEGLLIQVRDKQQTLNPMGGSRGYVDMPRVAYYSAAAYERNKREELLDKLNPYEREQGEKDGIVIDGDFIRLVSPANDTTHTLEAS